MLRSQQALLGGDHLLQQPGGFLVVFTAGLERRQAMAQAGHIQRVGKFFLSDGQGAAQVRFRFRHAALFIQEP